MYLRNADKSLKIFTLNLLLFKLGAPLRFTSLIYSFKVVDLFIFISTSSILFDRNHFIILHLSTTRHRIAAKVTIEIK